MISSIFPDHLRSSHLRQSVKAFKGHHCHFQVLPNKAETSRRPSCDWRKSQIDAPMEIKHPESQSMKSSGRWADMMDHDRGMGNTRYRYEEEDDRQSIYIGVPVPRGYRRKRRRRRSSMSSRDATDVERGSRHDHHRQHYECDDRDRYDLEAGSLDQPDHGLPPEISRTSEWPLPLETV
ncbi:hypothetical protein MHYP_G00261320 [Metynnis hypsauchen]